MKTIIYLLFIANTFSVCGSKITKKKPFEDTIKGYFNDDDLKDYIVKDKKNSNKVTFTIFINNGKTYIKKMSFDVVGDDFSDIENSIENLFITNPKKGEIGIGASCCGNFKSTEISYYKYYQNIQNWILYKNNTATIDTDFLPSIVIKYLDFSYTIDNKNIGLNTSLKNKELSDLKAINETLFKKLYDKYKNANDTKTSDRVSGSLNFDDLAELLSLIPLDKKNINDYNDLAYYLGQCKDGKTSSIFLLKEILKKEPSRVVAYLNLADAQWDFDQKDNAAKSYKKYSVLMKSARKDLTKIPLRVIERSK